MPTQPLPQIIPDILREVFLYFTPPKSSDPDLIPLDLFACSLVCKYWYIEACSLLDRYKFQPLILDSRYTSDELERIGDLFIECRRNGQDYFNKIASVLVDIISLTASDPEMKLSMPAVQTILAYLPPKQTDLCITPTITSKITGNLQLTSSFQWRGIPSILITTHIHLNDNSSSPIPTRQNHINDVIASLSLRLEFLKLTDVTFNAQTYDALRLCTTLREVKFERVSCDDLSSVVQSWPELRSFHFIYDDTRSRVTSMVHTLVRSCLKFESFTIFSSQIGLDSIVYYDDFLYLLTFAPMLTRIHVAHNSSITDDTMKAIMTIKAPSLEYLNLEGCTLFTGVSTRLQTGVWPVLKTLSLGGCRYVRICFVIRMITVCHSLQELELPDHLNQRTASSKLDSHGFECGQKNVWRRKLG